MNTAIIVVLAVAVLYWLFVPRKVRHSKEEKAKRLREERLSAQAANEEHPYQSVSLCSLGCGCPEVEALAQRRFLTGETPPLPLAQCSAKSCNCKYVHHQDRRYDGHGRSVAIAADASLEELPGAVERRARKNRGRRKTDRAA